MAGLEQEKERDRKGISFRGKLKCTHEDERPRYFRVLPLIGHTRVMTAVPSAAFACLSLGPKSTRWFPEMRGHPPAWQVLRSPNYQLIFVFTALRCTFVTLAEHDAASWGGKLTLCPPPRHRDAIAPWRKIAAFQRD